MQKRDFLVEIYTEELPPNCIIEFKQQLPVVVDNVLKNYRVEYKKIEVYLTPVRIIILVLDVDEVTKKEVIEIMGPSEKVGIKNGEFTPAAIGFAKKHNVELKDLFIKETQDGKFLCIKKTLGGENFKVLIPEILSKIFSQVKYHKMMVWEPTKFSFPRPIRNLLVIYGNEIVKIKLGPVKSTNYTYGIKTFPIKKIKISATKKTSLVEEYFKILKDECIIYDDKKRFDVLIKSIENITTKKKLVYDKDLQLLNEIVAITEYPSCVLCEFPKEFLQLPEEFIKVCMKSKQKFIPLYDETGKLVNMFIGVKNGPSEYLEYVKDGYQKVLIARLNDVKYYYDMDRKIEFGLYFDKLKNIIYNEKLKSSYYDKVLRTKELAKYLNRRFKFCNEEYIEVAVKLFKNDLLTQIVYEYPELQGIAGKIYALEYCKLKGLPEEIAVCCEEHLKPKSYQDSIPQNNLSVVLSLADKIATVIDNAVLDNLPTGSSDPLGIKRITDAVIKICKEKQLDINLFELFNFYVQFLTFNIEDGNKIYTQFLNFVTSRYENILLEEGYEIDEIRAVLFNFDGDFYTKWLLISTLKKFRSQPEFEKVVELYKRVYNILQQGKKKLSFVEENVTTVDEQLLIQPQEKVLYDKVLNVKQQVEMLYKEKKFDKITILLLELKPEVDKFFDTVLVFDNNIDIAKNRLKLLSCLKEIFLKIGALHLLHV